MELAQETHKGKTIGELTVPSIIPLARQAAAEGIVLLKNKHNILPLKQEQLISVFGRTALDYFTVGYGSGGDVRTPYKTNLMDGLARQNVNVNKELYKTYKNWVEKPEHKPGSYEWGQWPRSFPEMPLESETVKKAAQKSELALVVIGRAAGEARENVLEEGGFYLTNQEKLLLNQVTEYFDNVVVVLNCGNIIDLSWLEHYGDKIDALLYAGLGGMEGGNGAAEVLVGKRNPSGRLPATIADTYESYPSAGHFGKSDFTEYVEDVYVGYRYFETFAQDKVLFPFGFGLSYTSFSWSSAVEVEGTDFSLDVEVENTGDKPGKEVVQVYLSAPQGKLGQPNWQLAAFEKTKELQPGEKQTLQLKLDLRSFAAYDDSGVTGHKSAYVLEEGNYTIAVGQNVRKLQKIHTYKHPKTSVVKQLCEVIGVEPSKAFARLVNDNGTPKYVSVPTRTRDLKEVILEELPAEIPLTGDRGIKLQAVAAGEHSLEQFVAQLSPKELDDLSHGWGEMNSPLGAAGNAGVLGGITDKLREKGILPITAVDGPSGIRLEAISSLLPCGTVLASSFNKTLITELYALIAEEMKNHGAHLLLAPGLNIQRDPLGGRNFEYFSEDPLLTGEMGAAMVVGLQNNGVSACPKHLACNNQETNRERNDSRISERALREIYLKGFEITLKKSNPHAIMTSYNKINGVWSHYSYELATTVLRNEWGYDGLVITDWWMQADSSPEFPTLKNDAYRVRAQVDVLMPGGDGWGNTKVGRHLLDTYGHDGGITLGEMQRSAINVLKFVLRFIEKA